MLRLLLVAFLLMLARSGWAQEETPTKEEVEELKSVVEGMNESFTEYRGYVDALRKIKLSGYLQPQYRVADADAAISQFSGGNLPANVRKQFQIRRARLKVAYENVLSQYVLQIDAGQAGLSLKDAYVSITEPWIKSIGLQAGVFDRPFGYEISFSSGSRESPERSRVVQTLFPGERELGAKLFYAPQIGDLSFLRADLGVFNGTGPTSIEFDNFKDLIGRVGAQFPFEDAGAELDLGVSGYFGNVRNQTAYLWTGSSTGFTVDSAATNAGAGVSRNYVGVDAQFYYDLPHVGGTTLRGEVMFGEQPGGSTAPTSGDPSIGTKLTTISPVAPPSGPIYVRNFMGWYVYLVQNIGSSEQVVVKYDVYDPNSDLAAGDIGVVPQSSAADLRYSTLGLGFIHHWDENVKFVFYYEFVDNEKVTQSVASANSSLAPFAENVKDNLFTLRMQFRF
jgi:hypothetical protein